MKYGIIRRLDFAVLIGVIISVFMANVAVFGEECDQLRADVVRLHILANSDSAEDQAIKLKVRDRILNDVGSVFALPQSQSDAKAVARENLSTIKQAAEAELRDNGYALPVRVQLCNMYFTTREYDGLSLPAGNYDAVRVTIGEGQGKNWWCVMYPPICLSTATAPDSPELEEIEHLNGEPLFKPKLAVVELFENLFSKDEDQKEPSPIQTASTASAPSKSETGNNPFTAKMKTSKAESRSKNPANAITLS